MLVRDKIATRDCSPERPQNASTGCFGFQHMSATPHSSSDPLLQDVVSDVILHARLRIACSHTLSTAVKCCLHAGNVAHPASSKASLSELFSVGMCVASIEPSAA
jgi:hypothetical protein